MEHFPPIIAELPELDLPIRGVRGWLFQGEHRQAVFFRLEPGAEVPEHAHGAQWGIVIEGEIELSVGGEVRRCRKGDTYEVPEGAPHRARCPEGALVLDLFADPDRYRLRS